MTLGALGAAGASAATCPTGDDDWSNASGGLWNVATNWTGGIPGNSSNVCFPDLGKSYTVTLQPANGAGGGTVNTLTLGTPTGTDTETLDILGQSYVNANNETGNGEALGVAAGATINATGTLVLDSTANGAHVLSSDLLGGPAAFGDSPFGGGATITNYGQIVAEGSDYPTWNEQLNGNLINEPGAGITVVSGQLQQQTSNTVTNHGTVTTDAGGDYDVTSGGTSDVFTNDGTVVNHGTFEVGGQTGTFTQNGPVSGNPVLVEAGSTLADQSGAGAFTVEFGTNGLTGTIPAGQTVTVRGASFVSGGETQNYTTLALGGTVVNDGTLVLDATADGTKALQSDAVGGPAVISGGQLTNNGALTFQTDDVAYTNLLESGIVNAHGATATISGLLKEDQAVKVTNDGTLTLAPSAVYSLTAGGGGTFVNASDGTLVPQIASAASSGYFAFLPGCCAGGGLVQIGGAVAPALLGGFTPTAGEEFQLVHDGAYTGTFANVAAGFTGDYNPGFLGLVYGKAAIPISGTGGSVTPQTGGSVTPQTVKPLTRAQKLTRALAACRRLKHASRRAACIRAARKAYAPPKHRKPKR